jgi:hypothetical protein
MGYPERVAVVSGLCHPVTQAPDNKQNKAANLSEKIHMTPVG